MVLPINEVYHQLPHAFEAMLVRDPRTESVVVLSLIDESIQLLPVTA
jgi:hypothetical protein